MKSKKDISGSDNWYAEEKERESRILAWDIDEGRKLAEEHQALHRGSKTQRQRNKGTSDPFFVLDLILFSLMLPFAVGISSHSLFPVFLLFCFLLPGLLVWESVCKRFPPTWYFALALILSVALEIMEIRKLF